MEYFRQRYRDNLDQNWPVRIGEFSWPSAEVFEAMAESDYEVSFSEWVQRQKQEAKDRAKEFLEETRCLERFRTLTHRFKSGHVIPFVGAGLSIPSGFRPWGAFLISLLSDAPQLRSQVDLLLSQGRYEEVAQLVHDTLGAGVFAEEIHNQLGSHRRTVLGPVALLPHLFQEAVITTNFDYVLKYAYANAELPFSNDFCGRRLREARQRIGNEPHCLLRLHGEADVEDGRVLTQREYNDAYNGSVTLTNILGGLLGARSLLFMGSSLQSDRTYSALCDLKAVANDSPTRHYAFLPCPIDDERGTRRAFLASAGIHPIYYPADDHDERIEDLLVTLMEGGVDD
jgi:hypothetical protein